MYSVQGWQTRHGQWSILRSSAICPAPGPALQSEWGLLSPSHWRNAQYDHCQQPLVEAFDREGNKPYLMLYIFRALVALR